MQFKGFAEYVTEATKEVTFTFGRFNPPTTGHEKLLDAVAKVARGGKYMVYASQSNDPKKNPLDYTSKVKYMRKMFPKHARSVMLDKGVRSVFDILTKLYDQGYNKVNMVVGSDRVPEFEALTNKYNNVKGRHGYYNFEGGINIVSAGERDPDADDVSGMSASKMRAAASSNDFATFSKGLPRGFKDGQALFNDVRKGMGLKESYNYREHIEFQPVSEEREAYVQGELFAEGDVVVISESDEVGQVIMLGSNYVLVEMADGKKLRKWLTDVEKIDEGAFSDKTRDKIDQEKERMELKHARMMAKAAVDDERADDKKKTQTEAEDPDIGDRKGSQPANYHRGLSKSTKVKRDAQFKKQAKMDDDNPAAYKPAPGDAEAETKPSKHTKKYKQMYGEETSVMSFNSFNDVITEDVTTALKKKADKTGMPLSVLRQVYNRGVAAWRTGHRPGTTASQWGFARVNSFVTKSKGTWGKADKDLAAKVKGN
jgi:hypothetical protein